ncbi:MAG: hypothetical protein ACHQZS_12645 [Candidatus Binatales bacterium]
MEPEAASEVGRAKTVVVIGAGFSVGADLPLTREILSRAKEANNPRLNQMLSACELHLRDEISMIHGRLADEDIEDLLVKLRPYARPIKPFFLQSLQQDIDRPGRRYQDLSSSDRHEHRSWYTLDAYWTLLCIYFAMVSGPYEPHPWLDEVDEALPWDAEMPLVFREFFASLPPQTTILTTNYDEIIERGLLSAQRGWAYGGDIAGIPDFVADAGFKPGLGSYYLRGSTYEKWAGKLIWARCDWRPPFLQSAEAEVVLCRLHGSFRWIQCRNCAKTYAVDWWAAHPVGDFMGCWMPVDNDLTFRCWDKECSFVPMSVILVPGQKDRFAMENLALHAQLLASWKAVRACDRLIVIGSALRGADSRLVRMVRAAARRAGKVEVVNPSETAVSQLKDLTGRPIEWVKSLGEWLTKARAGQ